MRNGKIAKLPESVRNELNPRMERGESGTTILDWLNGLPVVQTTLKEEFDGIPISKQNLYEWRQGGFREWELKKDLFARALGARGMNGKIDVVALIGDLIAMIAAHYAGLMLTWDGEPDPKFEAKARMLGSLLQRFALIQRMTRQDGKVETKKRAAADDGGDFGVGGLLKDFQALLAGRAKVPNPDAARAAELVNEALAADRSDGTLSRAAGTAALPGTIMKEVLANVVELKTAGPFGSGPVKAGQSGSNQKIDFSAATEARVYSQRISP